MRAEELFVLLVVVLGCAAGTAPPPSCSLPAPGVRVLASEDGTAWTLSRSSSSASPSSARVSHHSGSNWRAVHVHARGPHAHWDAGALLGAALWREALAFARRSNAAGVSEAVRERVLAWWASVRARAAGQDHNVDGEGFWTRVGRVVNRLDGMVAVAGACSGGELTEEDLVVMQFEGDVADLEQALRVMAADDDTTDDTNNLAAVIRQRLAGGGNTKSRGRDRAQRNDEGLWNEMATDSRCSALVRRLPGSPGEVVFAHTTWAPYGEMIRVFTTLDVDSGDGDPVRVSFSGYAGLLASTDDWYQNAHGVAVMETTLNVIDSVSYSNLSTALAAGPRTWLGVPGWVRVIVAAESAKTAGDFVQAVSTDSSFTYNSQFFVLDKKREGQATGLLTVVESLPRAWDWADATSLLLSQGFVSGQNTPMLPAVRAAGLYPDTEQQRRDGTCHACNCLFSYRDNPRGCIFTRDAPLTTSVSEVQALMWSNMYKTDPLSLGQPQNAIAGRYDLLSPSSPSRKPFGGIDAKVSSLARFGRTLVQVNAPIVNEQCPPFHWEDGLDHPFVKLAGLGEGARWVEFGVDL